MVIFACAIHPLYSAWLFVLLNELPFLFLFFLHLAPLTEPTGLVVTRNSTNRYTSPGNRLEEECTVPHVLYMYKD